MCTAVPAIPVKPSTPAIIAMMKKRHSPSDHDLSPVLFYLQKVVDVLDSIYGLRQLRRPFFVLERVDGSGQCHLTLEGLHRNGKTAQGVLLKKLGFDLVVMVPSSTTSPAVLPAGVWQPQSPSNRITEQIAASRTLFFWVNIVFLLSHGLLCCLFDLLFGLFGFFLYGLGGLLRFIGGFFDGFVNFFTGFFAGPSDSQAVNATVNRSVKTTMSNFFKIMVCTSVFFLSINSIQLESV